MLVRNGRLVEGVFPNWSGNWIVPLNDVSRVAKQSIR